MPTAEFPTREGYTFLGFFDGDVKYYNADMTSAKNWDKNVGGTLYAEWEEIQYNYWSDEPNRDTDWPNNGNVDGDNYTIDTAAQLAQFAWTIAQGNTYKGKTVTVTQDIDLSAYLWPVALRANDDIFADLAQYESMVAFLKPFCGTFDGGNWTISGMTMTSPEMEDYAFVLAGLFTGIVDGTVKNVRLTDVNIDVETSTYANLVGIGGIAAGMFGGTVENCFVDGVISATNMSGDDKLVAVGGIVAGNLWGFDTPGTIRNCVNAATISLCDDFWTGVVGGIAAVTCGPIVNCLNMGDINETLVLPVKPPFIYLEGCVGGIAGAVASIELDDLGLSEEDTGLILNGRVENCLDTRAIVRDGVNIAGALVGGGFSQNEANISNSYWVDDDGETPPVGDPNVWYDADTVLSVTDAPGTFDVEHPTFGTDDLLTALNAWAYENNLDGKVYLGWVVKDDVNGGYPVLDVVYPTAPDVIVPPITDERLVPVFITAINVSSDDVATLTWQPLENAVAYFVYCKRDLRDTTWEGLLMKTPRATADDMLTEEVLAEDGSHTEYRFFTMRALVK